MRIAIDFNVARNEIVLVCENADSSCAESCINFIAPGMDTVTVHTEKGGETTQTVLTVTNGSACHVLDDAMMRTAGTFVIYAEDKQRLCFVVPENIPEGVEYSISLTEEGFCVKYSAPTGGGDHDCLVKSVNGQTGHVVIEIPEAGGEEEHECAVKSVNGQTGAVVLTAADVGALPTNGTAVNADKLGGQAPGFYLQKARNLLDNSDFTNPVNQRGKTSYIQEYAIDRWKAFTYYSNVIVKSSYVRLAVVNSGTEASMRQYIEPGKIRTGKTYTVALKMYGNSTIYAASGVAGNTMTTVSSGGNDENIRFGYYGAYYFVEAATASDCNIEWIALYEGEFTAETLPTYTPKEYAVELAECQRYYRKVISGSGYVGSTTAYIFLPFTMCAEPTATGDDLGYVVTQGKRLTPTEISSVAMYADSIRLALACSPPAQYYAALLYSAEIELSADL